MDRLDIYFADNNLKDPDDIDALLDCAEITRQLVNEKNYPHISRLVNYIIQNGYYEALIWTLGILQEEADSLDDFNCEIGGKIINYDDFVATLQVDFNPLKNEMEKVYDTNGEVESFFNIIFYKTQFANIFLVSSENFDTRDNDYIRYRLSFVKDSL